MSASSASMTPPGVLQSSKPPRRTLRTRSTPASVSIRPPATVHSCTAIPGSLARGRAGTITLVASDVPAPFDAPESHPNLPRRRPRAPGPPLRTRSGNRDPAEGLRIRDAGRPPRDLGRVPQELAEPVAGLDELARMEEQGLDLALERRGDVDPRVGLERPRQVH